MTRLHWTRIAMRMGPGLAALGMVSALQPMPALAGMPMPREVVCPIGGERFTYTTTPSYTIWGERPDGRPKGSWHFPLALPVCPDNGLVMYRDFTPEEVKRLKDLVASDAYRALAGETTYYRAWWLEKALVPESEIDAWILLRAVWQASDEPPAAGQAWADRHQRYRLLFVKEADALAARMGKGGLDWLAINIRAANAEREAGQFDAAARRLVTLRGTAEPAGLAADAAEQWKNWQGLAARLASAVDARDAALEPAAMKPAKEDEAAED